MRLFFSSICIIASSSAFLSNSNPKSSIRLSRQCRFSSPLLLSSSGSSSEIDRADNNNKRDTQRQSPWASSEWKFTLNFGREPGSWMPDEWGKSGGRLVVTVPMEITSDRPSPPSSPSSSLPLPSFLQKGDQQQKTSDLDPMLQKNSFRMNILSESSTYITMEGEQQCTFDSQGSWKIRLPSGKASGQCGKLMAYLDLSCNIQKNDIYLEKGERIYMTAKCWREEELERALNRLRPIHSKYRQTQERLNSALEHETGDRRLDGTDPLQTMLGMKDTAQLVLQRDEALRQYQEANRVYPTIDETLEMVPTAEELDWQEGPWPGQVEWLTIEPLYLMVRRKTLLKEEYHVIGTWYAAPQLEDD